MFSGLVAFLYYGCFLLLVGLVLFIALKGSRRSHGLTRLQCTFFLLTLSLLIWQSTLFLETRIALLRWEESILCSFLCRFRR